MPQQNIVAPAAYTPEGVKANYDANTAAAQANFTELYGRVRRSAGSPEGAITAPVGTLYLRSDGGAGTTLYVKESGAGNTGWVAK